MDKLLTFHTHSEKGIFLYTIAEGRDHAFLTKTASATFHPEIASYIASAKPIPGKTQVLLTALGAGEYYGENVNGDYFPETSLKNASADYGYKTFEMYAKAYKHHVNKDPNNSYGDVPLSVWNDTMKRVELIVILDNARAGDLVDRVNNGEWPEVSMGCKVPFDVCSICGNKAKTRAQYCDHLRYYMRKVPPGQTKKAYAINTMPKFFDISFVLIGADRIARVMKKVAHTGYEVSSTEMAEKVAFGLNRQKVAAKKVAEIEKDIPSNTEPNTVKNIEHIAHRGAEALRPLEPDLPKTVIIRITQTAPSGPNLLNRILSTLSFSGVCPKPHEFQSLVLRALGKHDDAEAYERRGIVFDPMSYQSGDHYRNLEGMIDIAPRNFDGSIFEVIRPHLEERSYARPLLERRVIRLVKMASENKLVYPTIVKKASDDRSPIGIMPLMIALATMYSILGKKAPTEAVSKFDQILGSHPGVALALGVGAATGLKALTQRAVMGKYDANVDRPLNIDPNMSWQQSITNRNMNPIMKTASLGHRLFLGVPGLYMASGAQEVRRARNPQDEEGAIGKFIRKYPDVASLALVGEGLAGYPITKRFMGLKKFADFNEDVKNTALFSLAFPGASLGVRGASMLIDQGIISGVSKLLTKKNNQRRTFDGNN